MKTYEELINSLRCCAEYPCYDCKYRGVYMDSCDGALKNEAADAIEDLSKAQEQWIDQERNAMLKSIPKWIPVTERLPEELWERVLAYTDDGTVMTLPAIKLRNGYVRYWMPLPEPPKEETE